MFTSLRSPLAAAMIAMIAAVPAARAQDSDAAAGSDAVQDAPAADPGQILATVNGTDITLANVIAVRAGLPRQYDRFPANVLFTGILDQLIQQALLRQSYEGELSLGARAQIENERRAVIAGEAISELMEGKIDEAALRDLYEKKYPADTGKKEYNAAHILVKTEEEAQKIVADLADGADFAALAKEKSTGPSGSAGGDLGWFAKGDMVAPFFDAAAALEPGEVSAPVKTQFGWHVIKLNDVRDKKRPAFEEVRAELEQQLRQKILEERVASLMKEAKVERSVPEDFDPAVINNQTLLEN